MRWTSMPDSGASFSRRCMTSNVIDCVWGPKAVNDIRSLPSEHRSQVVQVCLVLPHSSSSSRTSHRLSTALS